MKLDKIMALMDERHLDLFAEFSKYEILSGGPDSHLEYIGYMAKNCDLAEKLWRGGCYISAYNVATAEVFWQNWPWPKVLEEPMLPWLIEHWAGLTTRVERKGVRIPANMEEFFLTYATWMAMVLSKKSAIYTESLTPVERYNAVWDETQKTIKHFGRYVGIKLMEYLYRHCDIDLETPDIRPIGAWSPRTTLALLYPERMDWLLGNDDPKNIAVVNETCLELLDTLREGFDLNMTMFQLEVLLCNYRQAYQGHKHYPGRIHDTEVRYFDKIAPYWQQGETEFWDTRKAVFPVEHLGEMNNWRGVRNELGLLTSQGFIWSDLVYDYSITKDITKPARREQTEMLSATEIIPGKLYTRGVFHTYTLQHKVDFLNNIDVDTVVNLWHSADQELVNETDVIYHHHYFQDSNVNLDGAFLIEFAAELAEAILQGHSVLVHCYGGKNRSNLLAALIYRELRNCTGAEALAHVRSCKPKSISTPLFVSFLESLPEP